MLNTPDKPQNSHEPDNPIGFRSSHVLYLRLVLITLVLIVALVGISSHNGRSSTAHATDSSVGEDGTAKPQASPSYLEYTAWPQAFQIKFSANYLTKNGKTISLPGNQLFYQAAENDVKFKSVFPKCLNLPGVPLSFVGHPCEFYMGRDPSTNKYAAYVYSTKLKESFLLARNFGPPAQDFVARYNKLLTQPPLSAPLAGTPIPVRGPADGEPVQWFLTAGTNKTPVPANLQGYYAAMAKPVGFEASLFKPPYSFAGAAPGVHGPSDTRFVYGQLVYEPLTFVINPSFGSETFMPPPGYAPIEPLCWPVGQLNCATCHVSDPPYLHIFYTQKGRTKTRCKSPEPQT